MLLWLGAYISNWLAGWLSGYISMTRRRVPTLFPQWPSHPLWCLLFKKANHFTMTTLNIRSDPMATWECAKQVQASPQLLGKRNAYALPKKNTTRWLKFLFLDRLRSRFEGTTTGGAVSAYIISLYFILVRRGMVRLVCHMLTCYVSMRSLIQRPGLD